MNDNGSKKGRLLRDDSYGSDNVDRDEEIMPLSATIANLNMY